MRWDMLRLCLGLCQYENRDERYSIMACRRVPSTGLIDTCMQSLHIFFRKFKIVKLRILLDTTGCDRLGQDHEFL